MQHAHVREAAAAAAAEDEAHAAAGQQPRDAVHVAVLAVLDVVVPGHSPHAQPGARVVRQAALGAQQDQLLAGQRLH